MKLLFLLCCSMVYCMGNAQLYQLAVNVTDPRHNPVPDAQLRIADHKTHVVTDAGGTGLFKELLPGTYYLHVFREGYQPFTKKIAITTHDRSIVVTLQPEAGLLQEVQVNNTTARQRKNQEQLNLEIIKSDFIQKNLGGSLLQSLERLPGVKTISIGSGQSKPLLRGLGFNRVAVIDGYIKHEGQQWGADHGLEIDQFAVEELEILKGAASFAYGSDAIAGAINIKHPVPPAPRSLGGNVNLIGKTNNALYGGSLELHGRTQKWFGTGRITFQDYADYRVPADSLYVYDYPVQLYRHHLRNTAGRELNGHLTTGYISGRFKSVFDITNIYNKSGFFANAHGLEPRNVNTAIHDADSRDILMPYQQVNHFKLINRSHFMIHHHVITMAAGYQNNHRREYNHYVTHGYMPAVYPDTMTIPVNLERAFRKNTYSLNAKDMIAFGNHELEFGFNSEIQKNTINGWSFLVPAFDQKSIGVFIYDKIHLTDRTLLHGALRYDHTGIRIHDYTDWFPSPVAENGDTSAIHISRAGNTNRDFNSITGSIGINHNRKHLSLKANIGKSYRVPIAKELAANGVNYHYFSYEKGNAALDPEASYQIDASAVLDQNRWQVQLSPFFNYFPNYIYLNPTPDHDYLYGAGNQVFEYRQSRVMRYGAELQITYRLLKNLSAEFLGEYLYSRQLSGNKKGYTLPFSPAPTALMNLTFQPIKTAPFHQTYFSVDYRLSAPQNNIVPPEKKTKGFTVLNIQAGTRFIIGKQQARLSLQLQNAFNTRYMVHTSFYRLIGLPEPGRNLILSLKIPFNFLNHKEQ
ncbi:TonB-dependent receptor [Niabella beijingensis]|uniref:TonB-dependent receptor n=1 Tax=Niabella beijingensis TaxID=2872700 RepID=UPI001CBB9F8D|nr:TonB-dependent receptor [Niabella beijingensis]MBZ4192472.1 TonB-dependent receptor [Niabella beijingensis]